MNTRSGVQSASREPAPSLPGWLLLAMLCLALGTALGDALPGYVAGVPLWLAAALLIRRQRRAQLIQSAILLGVGAIALGAGLALGADGRYLLKALEGNQMVVAMLLGVSFLRLLAVVDAADAEGLPSGRRALWQTLLGGHLIGAVINMSSVMILGDRLGHRQPMTALQGLTLLRAFTTCACWSPFFAAMGVVLLSAPGSQLGTLVAYGLPVSAIALLLSAWQIARHPQAAATAGYPMHWRAIRMPVLLAALVMLAHHLWPRVSVLTLVTLIALLFTLLWLPLRQGAAGLRRIAGHVREGLPALGGEVTLFLAAAVLAAGVGALLESLGLQLAPERFGAPQACATLLCLVALAMLGLHPVTSAVLAGSLLMPSVSEPNLLGLTLLYSWALGTCLSPLSGVQLSLQSRYGIGALELFRMNALYGPAMLVVCFAMLYLYADIAGR